jgi:hypothetical protein
MESYADFIKNQNYIAYSDVVKKETENCIWIDDPNTVYTPLDFIEENGLYIIIASLLLL